MRLKYYGSVQLAEAVGRTIPPHFAPHAIGATLAAMHPARRRVHMQVDQGGSITAVDVRTGRVLLFAPVSAVERVVTGRHPAIRGRMLALVLCRAPRGARVWHVFKYPGTRADDCMRAAFRAAMLPRLAWPAPAVGPATAASYMLPTPVLRPDADHEYAEVDEAAAPPPAPGA